MLQQTRPPRLLIVCAILLVACARPGVPSASAAKVVLKNKTVIEGDLVPIKGLTPALIARSKGPTETFPIIMVHAGYKRYFVPRLQVDWNNTDQTPGRGDREFFDFKRRFRRRKPGFRQLGSVKVVKPWSEFGRRTVEVWIPRGNKFVREPIVQGVTKITPKYLEVEGITHDWKHGIAVTSVQPDALDAMIRKTIDPKKPSDRMAIVRFYLEAGLYPMAARELPNLLRDFPEYKEKVKEARFQLRQLTARRILRELRRRRRAGQHRLVYKSCSKFPTKDLTPSVLREITAVKKEYDESRSSAERALTLLMDLESQLKNPKTLKAVKPMRSEVRAKLDVETLPRLDAFLKLADEKLSASEQLALAYSGWILGSGNAHTNLDLVIRQWEARFLAIEFLRTANEFERQGILKKIERLEGVKPEHLGQMVPYLPPWIETPGIKPGEAKLLTVTGRDGKPDVKYAVLLPPEYNPHRRYPAIVALRPRERTIQSELLWWGGDAEKPGQAQRHGYIVIAPEYAAGKNAEYDYSSQAHAAVIEALRDARKRFSIDSDRVFLSGHGSGGDAAFDMGMSHPDLFAGVIPIVGISDKYCMWYYQNARNVPWYIVGGELARNSLERNARELTRMMTKSPVFDVIYAEYIGRGYESFYEEIHRLFDWMALHRRNKYPKRFEVKVLRASDDRFWWVKASGFPSSVTHSSVLVPGVRKTRPMPLKAWVNAGNTINLHSGAAAHDLWLSPEFVDYSKRVVVTHFGRRLFNDFLSRDIGVMLDDLRVRGDRQKLYWSRLHVARRIRRR